MFRNHFEAEEVLKCKRVVDHLEAINYHGEELSKKQFEALFKGLRLCTIGWLREYYNDGGRCRRVASRWNRSDKNRNGFAYIVREEHFIVPNKKDETKDAVVTADGTIVEEVKPYEFKRNPAIRSLVTKAYGECEVREISKPIIGKRYFYKIDIDGLRECASRNDDIRSYYSAKVAKLQRQMKKYESVIALCEC